MNFENENRLALRSNGQEGRVEYGALSFAHVNTREKRAALWWPATPTSRRASSESVKGHKS